MNQEELYWISLPYATFGIIVEENVVIKTAPIGKWMMGKSIYNIKYWVLKKKGIIKKI